MANEEAFRRLVEQADQRYRQEADGHRARGVVRIAAGGDESDHLPVVPDGLVAADVGVVGVVGVEGVAELAQLAQWYAQGLVKPAIDTRLPMHELPAAYARMGSRQVMGKVLMVND
jgi:D-arabinose 1-dehydrogenase-like Zn-dependent alcohol dehydrogenase